MLGKYDKMVCMEKNNIKLAIFDIDGTLIERGETHIKTSAIEAIQKIRDKGIEVMIATGRAYYFIQDDIHERMNPDYYVTVNGAIVYDIDHNVIHEVPMLFDEVNELTQYARDNDLAIGYKLKDDMHIFSDFKTFTSKYLQGSPKISILKDFSNEPLLIEGEELPKGIFMMGNENKIYAAQNFLEDGYVSKAYSESFDVYSKRAGKMRGIEVVLKRLNIKWDEIIAFGDADNDVDMLSAAKIGVAMGDAPEHVKEVADYVTTDLNDNGISNAIHELLL